MDNVQQAIALISDPDPSVRERGAVLLAGLELNQAEYDKAVAPAIGPIIALLDDSQSGVRKAALIALAKLSPRQLGEAIMLFKRAIIPFIPQSVALLNDEESGARRASAKTLQKRSNQADTKLQKAFAPAIPQSIALLNDEESRRARAKILQTLSNLADMELQKAFAPAIPQLIALLNNREPGARQESAYILRSLSNWADSDTELQKAFALAIPQFIALLNNRKPGARRDSAYILRNLSRRANTELQKAFAPVIPHFIALLNDEEPGARRASVNILEKLLNRADTELKKKAFAPAIPKFIALLNDQESNVRKSSVAALGTLAYQFEFQEAIIPAIPQIIALLSHENSDIRRASLDTLRKLAVQDALADEFRSSVGAAIPQIAPLLTDSNSSVRIASVCLLLELSGHAEFQQALQSSIPQINALPVSDVDVLGEHATMLDDVYKQGVNPGMPSSESDIVKYGTETEHIKATTYWIAAEHALEHARSKISLVSEVFDRWKIPTSEYAILAGFDQSLIQSGVGYLEQIHVFLSESAEAIATSQPQLLTELGKLFSPFSSVLVTESSSRYLSVFKDDGSVWDFDELVYCTASKYSDGGASAKMPLVVISLSQNSSWADGSSQFTQGGSGSGSREGEGEGGSGENRASEKGEKRVSGDGDSTDKGGNGDEDPGDNPEDPSGNQDGTVDQPGKISFEIGSKIYLPQDNQNVFQTITTHGSLTIKTAPLLLAERPAHPRYSERHVQFEGLVFHATHPMKDIAYKQFHAVVVIDSQQENARIMSINPKTTTDGDRDEKRLITTKRGRVRGAGAALSLGFGGASETHAHGSISGTAMNINEEIAGFEKKQYHSAITAHRADGIVRWGFNVDDANLQTWGMDMEDADVLPRASFGFVGDSNVPAPPPKSVVAIVVSHWSILIPLENASREMKRTWIRKLLGRFGVSGGGGGGVSSLGTSTGSGTGAGDPETMVSYSNLFQIVALDINTDKLHEPAHYKAKLEVRSGSSGPPDIKRPAGESVNVTPAVVDDFRKLTRSNFPMMANLKLADTCVPWTAMAQNLVRDDDIKSH